MSGTIGPVIVRQIHHDRFGSAADNNPLKWDLAGRIDLLVGKPRGNKKEISSLQRSVKLASLAPPNIRRSAQDISDGVLRSVMMYPRARAWLHQKPPAPHGRFNACSWMNSRESLRTRRLSGRRIKLIGPDYSYRPASCAVFLHALVCSIKISCHSNSH